MVLTRLSYSIGATVSLSCGLRGLTKSVTLLGSGFPSLQASAPTKPGQATQPPSHPPRAPPCALQVLSGVEQQQGADGADVAGKAPEPLLGLILRLWLGVHTHGEVFQLLLAGAGVVTQAWWAAVPGQSEHPFQSKST